MKPDTRIRRDRSSEYRPRDRTRSSNAKRLTRQRRAQRALKGQNR